MLDKEEGVGTVAGASNSFNARFQNLLLRSNKKLQSVDAGDTADERQDSLFEIDNLNEITALSNEN